MPQKKLLEITVIPRAGKTELVSRQGNVLKIKLKSPPADNAANEELIRFRSEAETLINPPDLLLYNSRPPNPFAD